MNAKGEWLSRWPEEDELEQIPENLRASDLWRWENLKKELYDRHQAGDITREEVAAEWVTRSAEIVKEVVKQVVQNTMRRECQAAYMMARLSGSDEEAAYRVAYYSAWPDGGNAAAIEAARAALETHRVKRWEERKQRQIKKVKGIFEAWCPQKLHPRSFDLSKVRQPGTFTAAFDAYRRYDIEVEEAGFVEPDYPKGLYLYGATGAGKTRCALALVKEAAERGEGLELHSATELKDEFAMLATTGEGNRYERIADRIAELQESSVLLIDDLGHTFSESFGERLRSLLERFDHRLIVTANYAPAAMLKRWEREFPVVRPIMRRILDHCGKNVYNLDKPPVAST